jgi:hypothetical protein
LLRKAGSKVISTPTQGMIHIVNHSAMFLPWSFYGVAN